MAVEITWYGHATWLVEHDGHKILIDPFFNDSPVAPIKADEVSADHILISHGHFDHISDAASIANRTGATVVAIFEIAQWLSSNHQVQNTIGMNIGGKTQLPFGSVKMTPALHSSQLPDGTYGGEPAGFLLELAGRRIYFAADTGLFTDMKLIAADGLDVAVLPIGDLFTMGPEDSVQATKWLNPNAVLPAHYNTWPPIEQDADRWAETIRKETSAQPVVLHPGESYSI